MIKPYKKFSFKEYGKKIQQITKSEPNASLLFGKWLSRQGLDSLTNRTFTAGKLRGRRCRIGARTRGAQRDI